MNIGKFTGKSLAVATLAALMLAACGRGPEDTARKFYSLVENNDVEGAISVAFGDSLPKGSLLYEKALGTIGGMSARIAKCDGIKGVTFENVSGSDNYWTGRAIVTLNNEKCGAIKDVWKLVKRNGKWTIAMGG